MRAQVVTHHLALAQGFTKSTPPETTTQASGCACASSRALSSRAQRRRWLAVGRAAAQHDDGAQWHVGSSAVEGLTRGRA